MVATESDPPATLIGLLDREPYELYQSIQQEGKPRWDAGVHSWLVADHDLVHHVFSDEETFPRLTALEVVGKPDYIRIIGSKHPTALDGQERLDHRRWWLGLFDRASISEYRVGLIADATAQVLDGLGRTMGDVDLVTDYAGAITIRVIAGVLGLPWQDDSWLTELRSHLDKIERFKSITYLSPDDAAKTAAESLTATYRVDEMIAPYLEAGRTADGMGILSRVWRDELFTKWGWDDEDVYGLVRMFFDAGSSTTRNSLSNALHLALTTPGLRAELADASDDSLAAFVEEALRIHSTIHFRPRKLSTDVTLAGVRLRRGDRLIAITAAANRDPKRWPAPMSVDLRRENARQHLTFSLGLSSCTGAALARAEMHEGIRCLFRRFPDIALMPTSEPPALIGMLFRYRSPLVVRLGVA